MVQHYPPSFHSQVVFPFLSARLLHFYLWTCERSDFWKNWSSNLRQKTELYFFWTFKGYLHRNPSSFCKIRATALEGWNYRSSWSADIGLNSTPKSCKIVFSQMETGSGIFLSDCPRYLGFAIQLVYYNCCYRLLFSFILLIKLEANGSRASGFQ